MLRHAVLALVLLAATASAFSPATGRPLRRRTAVLRHLSADADPLTKEESRELLAAIEKVEAAAEKFDPETKTFADQWIKKMLASKDDKAEMVGLLDECLIDENSSNCVEFEEALTALQQLVGGIAAEQF